MSLSIHPARANAEVDMSRELCDRRDPSVTGAIAVPWLARTLLAAVAALTAIHLGTLAYHLWQTVGFAYDLNYGEGYLLFDAVRLSRGEPMYVDLQQFPMVRSPYPPLYPLVWSALIPLAGPAFWPGRLLSVMALVGIGALVAWSAWRVRRDIWPCLAAVGLVAACPFVYQWAGYARVDLVALLCATAGVVAAQWVGGRRGLILAAVLCTLAVWTKQTAITATVAVALAFGLRSWRNGAAFLVLVGAPSALGVLVLNASSGGEFVRQVLAGNSTNPILPLRAGIYMGTFVALHLIALVACGWWLKRALHGSPAPIAVYLPVTLFAALSVGNGGSSVNYLIEPVVALALAVPFAWRALQLSHPPATAAAAPLFAALQLLLLVHWPNTFGTSYMAENALGRTPSVEDVAIGAHLDDVVRSAPGDVIAEPAGFAIRNGRGVYVQPIDLRAEQLRGRWRSEPLVTALNSGRFSTIMTAYNLFPADAERTIDQHFTLAETLASPDGLTFKVYRYRP